VHWNGAELQDASAEACLDGYLLSCASKGISVSRFATFSSFANAAPAYREGMFGFVTVTLIVRVSP
jgi:hypothetical protein